MNEFEEYENWIKSVEESDKYKNYINAKKTLEGSYEYKMMKLSEKVCRCCVLESKKSIQLSDRSINYHPTIGRKKAYTSLTMHREYAGGRKKE